MKVSKIKTNSDTWYELEEKVDVMSGDEVKSCERFYFNGFNTVFMVEFNDGNSHKFTSNHRLWLNHDWKRVDEIRVGDLTNNDLQVTSVTEIGIEPTMDMEVPDTHYYVLDNGVHSHNSSFILGQVSQSIEPLMSNFYIKDLAKIKHPVKNKFLEKLLEEKDKNTNDVWESIAVNDGSVQHLDFLSDHEKEVFLTFKEINPRDIINQAAVRQEYLDQLQSLNLMIDKRYSVKEVNQIIIDAWKLGICTLYYQHSVNSAQDFARSKLSACVACEA